ncbi:peptidylprolyl isomerase [Candidatus Thiothrix sp. Deng01]|uniref:Peptidyl-prolyl cis-trans isomerase n=1 Tax=Candidatus Thiothrix phosphatis TaxID=3112415 RepID=A0ABU6CY32_9GAMM|nr:peptidylprolyl isomerase [Candidatus Thiothrix sp. Deng01]MEB4590977.1 peptidylprolyl isomerase [Candidatus Thiothrix sp. Deng01]
MQIAQHTVVTMTYTLTNDKGEILDQADASHPFAYLHGASNIIAGLEKQLTGKQANDSMTVTVPPAEAYGEYDERMTQKVPRAMFQGIPEEQIVAGAEFHAQTAAGNQVIRISAVDNDSVTIDANHPLAGVPLTFDLTILEVRPATAEEIDHGHAHGAHGHHHH